MSMRIPRFTAEASLYRSGSGKKMIRTHNNPHVGSRILPQVMQDPSRPRPIIKNCTYICVYVLGNWECTLIC